jgi:hypothetical protein
MSSQRKPITKTVDTQPAAGRKPRALREGATGSAAGRSAAGDAQLDVEKEAARP